MSDAARMTIAEPAGTMRIRGMYGIGDCLHQRAILRDLSNLGQSVELETFYHAMFYDLEGNNLSLRRFDSIKPRIRDESQRTMSRTNGRIHADHRITYNRAMIAKFGSILAAQYSCVGLQMPERPDFSLPVPKSWQDRARARISKTSKPIMVYRPVVLNSVWKSEARAPLVVDYAALFQSVRSKYHVVSVANLGDSGEYIVGEVQDADQYFHGGELCFEELAGLFSIADLAFTCPGFAPVLSQAVGARTVIVYGGNESYKTTNSVGAHLADTLALEPINPCACHLKEHDCDKTMNVPFALERLQEFVTCAS